MKKTISQLSSIDLDLVTGGKGVVLGGDVGEGRPTSPAKQRIAIKKPKTFDNNFNLTKLAH
ncbi:MAG: hypothetical protein AB7O24_21535 [Kofleriaceae bacterium]